MILVDHEVIRRMPKHLRSILVAKFSDQSFQAFLDGQIAAMRLQIEEHEPGKMTAEQYFQSAKELRLGLQMWKDFQAATTDWMNEANRAPNQ